MNFYLEIIGALIMIIVLVVVMKMIAGSNGITYKNEKDAIERLETGIFIMAWLLMWFGLGMLLVIIGLLVKN